MKRTEPLSLLTPASADTTSPTTGDVPMPEPETAGLSPSVQKHIGNLLKVSFQDLLTEPVPDRFANLLEQLEQAEKKGK